MALEIKKQIYDSVHGYIGLTDVELKVINSPLFQRLKSITCLGTVNFVYPGATNNRLEHSLGTMFMMQQFLSHVRVNGSIVDDKIGPLNCRSYFGCDILWAHLRSLREPYCN